VGLFESVGSSANVRRAGTQPCAAQPTSDRAIALCDRHVDPHWFAGAQRAFSAMVNGFGNAVRVLGSGRASQLPWLIRLARTDLRESLTVFGLGQIALVHVAAAVMLQGNLVIVQLPAQL